MRAVKQETARMTTESDPTYVKWMQRRAVAIFASFLTLVFGSTAFSEMDRPLYAVDDLALLLVGVVSLVMFLYVYRNRKAVADIKKSLNVFVVLFVVGLLIKILFAGIEASDADAFGDEVPSIIIVIFVLISRFV